MTTTQEIIKKVATDYVYEIFEEIKQRTNNRWSNKDPLLGFGMKILNYCYVCDRKAEEIFAVRDKYPHYGTGWLACETCKYYILKFFRPAITLKNNQILCPDAQQQLALDSGMVQFMRRTRSRKTRGTYPFIQKNSRIQHTL